MTNFLKYSVLGVLSLLLTSYAQIQQITRGLASSSRHSGNNPMTSYTWRGHARRGIHRRKVTQCRLAGVLLLWMPLYTATAPAQECPPKEPPLVLFERIKECKLAVPEHPEVPKPQQAPSCKVSTHQACPPPPKTVGVLTDRGYGCDSQTGEIVGPQSHKASSRTRCLCRHPYQCRRETEELQKDYEARVAEKKKEWSELYAQAKTDLEKCKEGGGQARERAERKRADERSGYERQRQACDRQAKQEAQRQAESDRQRKEQAVKDHLEAFEAALARGGGR